jgi:hypothetical protein
MDTITQLLREQNSHFEIHPTRIIKISDDAVKNALLKQLQCGTTSVKELQNQSSVLLQNFSADTERQRRIQDILATINSVCGDEMQVECCTWKGVTISSVELVPVDKAQPCQILPSNTELQICGGDPAVLLLVQHEKLFGWVVSSSIRQYVR